MFKKVIAYFLTIALLFSFTAIMPSNAMARENMPFTRQETLQPLGTQFEINNILSWTPESDPDARYNVSKVPLADRETGYVLNPYANPDAKMILSSDAYPIGGSASHSYGTVGAWRRYAPNFWQYVDIFNFWGGPINLPTPELVDAAHRNGVPVVGTIFFSNSNVGGAQRALYFNQGTAAEPYYPFADKLWEIADFYGFDGWFFNFESTGTVNTTNANGQVHAREIAAFLSYMQATKPHPHMILTQYDSPTYDATWGNLGATAAAISAMGLDSTRGSFMSRLVPGNLYKIMENKGTAAAPVWENTADYMFGDYKWSNRSHATNTLNTATHEIINADPYRFTFSWPIHMGGYMTIGPGGSSDSLNGLMSQAPWIRHNAATSVQMAGDESLMYKSIASLGLFGGHSPINLSTGVGDYINLQDPRLWSGYRGLATGDAIPHDPSAGYLGLSFNPSNMNNRGPANNAQTGIYIDGVQINNEVQGAFRAEAWHGFSQFLTDKTVILDFPFATRFNPGIGHNFFVDGAREMGDWSNRGIQDILPTWRWTVLKHGESLTPWTPGDNNPSVRYAGDPASWEINPSFDVDDAWYGGASLSLKGVATAVNEVRLYSTFLDFEPSTGYELSYVAKGTPVQFGFYTAPDYSSYIIPGASAAAGEAVNGWTAYTQNLNELQGKTIYGIGIFVNAGTVDVNIGQIVVDKSAKPAKLPAPANLTLDGYLARDRDNGEARIFWDAVSGDADRYDIYQVYADGSRRFLNATFANAFFLSNIERDPGSSRVVLEVAAVDASLRTGAPARISFDFGMGEDDATIVAIPYNPNLVADPDGTWLNLLVQKENASEPGKALFDGDRLQSKWCVISGGTPSGSNNRYVVFDTGEPITAERWLTVHAGGIESLDFNTRTFRLEYLPLGVEWQGEWENGGSGNTYGETVNAQPWVVADRVVDNPMTEAGNIVDRDFPDGPITAHYWRFFVEQAMWGSASGAIRVFELELYEHPKQGAYMPVSDSINANQVKVVRDDDISGAVYFKNIPNTMPGARANVYDAIDAVEPVASAPRQPNGEATVAVSLAPEGGRLYIDVQYAGYGPSNRFAVDYDALDAVKTRIPTNVALNTARFGYDYGSEVAHVRPGDGTTANAQGVLLWAGAANMPTANTAALNSPRILNLDIYYGAIEATLSEGARLYLYNNENDVFPARISAPVSAGAIWARIDALRFNDAGGFFWVSAKEPGKAESVRFRVNYTGGREIFRDPVIELIAIYESALDRYPDDMEDYYTPESWAELQAAFAEVKAVLDDAGDAGDDGILLAADRLLNAIDSLVIEPGDGPNVSVGSIVMEVKAEARFIVQLGSLWNRTVRAEIYSDNEGVVAVDPDMLTESGYADVKALAVGAANIFVTFYYPETATSAADPAEPLVVIIPVTVTPKSAKTILLEQAPTILSKGLTTSQLPLEGKTLRLFLDGVNIVLSTSANNRNIEGLVDLGDGWFLRFDIKGNGSNVKIFEVFRK